MLLLVVLLCQAPAGTAPQSLLAPIDTAMGEAEASLRAGNGAEAARRYASALASGWRLVSALEQANGHPTQAGEALARASDPLSDSPPAIGRSQANPQVARVAALTDAERRHLRASLSTSLARGYFNLGILAAQQGNFARASRLLEVASGESPGFPQLQASLGVAYFNLQHYDKATGPLSRAVSADPSNANLRRMLALAWLALEAYDKAAALLEHDPERERDPSLEYAYGLALVRSGRAAEAERIFGDLVSQHADSAPLTVILGEAQAEQGDFDAATRLLQQALTLDPHVADANGALGTIYFKQGRLDDAERALRAELAGHPESQRATQMLATVLDLQGRGQEAVPILQAIVASRPDAHDARYLLGKILLAEGHAADAVPHLQEAVRLAPDDPSGHYQLAQAYRQLGQDARADEQLERYRTLKDTQRGRRP